MKTIFTDENAHLCLKLHEDGSGSVLDKVNGAQWIIGPVALQDIDLIANDVVWNRRSRYWADYFIGRFQLSRLEDGWLRVDLLRPPWEGVYASFRARWKLEGRSIELRVEGIEEKLPSLNYPPPIESASLVIPDGVGRWIREDCPGMTCEFMTHNGGMNMRWVGGLAADRRRGWMLVFEDAYEDSGTYRNNLSIGPTWLKSMRRWGPTRSARYHFCDGGYVGMAKLFRRYAYDNRLCRSLEDKAREVPALRDLLGGRVLSFFHAKTHHVENLEHFFRPVSAEDRAREGELQVNFTFAETARAIDLAQKWGMRGGIVNLRGVFPGGYDDRHPDIWPPEPALGGAQELAALCSRDGPIHSACHDNYQDIYRRAPTFPRGIIRNHDGHLLHGGHWDGGLAFIQCSKEQLGLARRNWEQLRNLGARAHFADTASCVQFYQCWHPEHPTTRAEDRAAKMRLMAFYKEQGLIFGSEEAADFGVYYLDWLENRHTHVPRMTPPLWPLVFHDSVFCATYSSEGTAGGVPQHPALNFLWGYMAYWPVQNPATWRSQEHLFKQSLAQDEFHRRIGMDEMLTHTYLGEDELVERTEFSSGIAVLANFSKEIREVDGRAVYPGSYTVLD